MTTQIVEVEAVTNEELRGAAGGKAGTAELGWPPVAEGGRGLRQSPEVIRRPRRPRRLRL